MDIRKIEGGRGARRGSAMIVALIALVVLFGLAGAYLTLAAQVNDERDAAIDDLRALYVANSGVGHVVANLYADVTDDVGSHDQPIALQSGGFFADLVDNGDGTYTVTATGTVRRTSATVEAVVAPVSGGIYSNAVFAGNSDGDPNYTLDFGGVAGQADEITGDIYSGGNIELTGDATVDGTVRAYGAVTGTAGETNVSQPLPDLSALDYENTADVDVATLFQSATYKSDNSGGYAWQLPESNPAHIFRKNASDRSWENGSTAKDDYYLEDPYEAVNSDAGMDGSNAFKITLAGTGSEPGSGGNQAVYFIDGNLWIHNMKTFSFKFYNNDVNGTQITFVVKGNIYISDNLFYTDSDKDGVAFIAMKDDDVEDSGNVYFGDPEFGTLEYMQAFLYAENNFYDNNLDSAGSADVTLDGNMTAGNQVLINRDFGDEHSKLTVNFDNRIAEGMLDLPGLPPFSGTSSGWTVASWRRVARP